jgi:hypothetical protein
MTSKRGLLTLIAGVVLAYVGIYFVLETIHESRRHHATTELSTFFALHAVDKADTFMATMKRFGTTQRIAVPPEPAFFNPIGWLAWAGAWEQPNRDLLWRWALKALQACKTEQGKCTTLNAFRIELTGADLRGADLGGRSIGAGERRFDLLGVDVHNADLSYGDLRGANLVRANLEIASLAFADLRDADLTGANLTKVNLSGADLRGAEISQEQLNSACVLPDLPATLPTGLSQPPACELD